MPSKITIYRLDLSDGTTKIIKHVETIGEAERKIAAFNRILKNLDAKNAIDDYRYFWKANDAH